MFYLSPLSTSRPKITIQLTILFALPPTLQKGLLFPPPNSGGGAAAPQGNRDRRPCPHTNMTLDGLDGVISRSQKWKSQVASDLLAIWHLISLKSNFIRWPWPAKSLILAPCVCHPSKNWASCCCLVDKSHGKICYCCKQVFWLNYFVCKNWQN